MRVFAFVAFPLYVALMFREILNSWKSRGHVEHLPPFAVLAVAGYQNHDKIAKKRRVLPNGRQLS
jgi:hypothetical protein